MKNSDLAVDRVLIKRTSKSEPNLNLLNAFLQHLAGRVDDIRFYLIKSPGDPRHISFFKLTKLISSAMYGRRVCNLTANI